MRLEAKLGEYFPVYLEYEADAEEVTSLKVFSKKTGEEVTDLIFGTSVWDEAWSAADRHLIYAARNPEFDFQEAT